MTRHSPSGADDAMSTAGSSSVPSAPFVARRSSSATSSHSSSASAASSLSDWRAFFSLGSHKQKKKPHQLALAPLPSSTSTHHLHASKSAQPPKELAQQKNQQKLLRRSFGIDCGVKCVEGDTGHALEDRVLIKCNDQLAVLAVIDGHGGALAADFVALNLFAVVEKTLHSFEEELQPQARARARAPAQAATKTTVTKESPLPSPRQLQERKKSRKQRCQEELEAAMVHAIERMDGAFVRRATRVQDLSGACLLAVVVFKSSIFKDAERGEFAEEEEEEEESDQQEQTSAKESALESELTVMTIHCGDCRVVSGRRRQQAAQRQVASPQSGAKDPKILQSPKQKQQQQQQQQLMVSDFEVRALTEDHCASNRSERQRVLSHGGIIQDNRVAGVLEPFRSIGDIDVKTEEMDQWVIATPEVAFHQVFDHPDNLLVLATDGIWSVLPNEEAIAISRHAITERASAKPQDRLQLAAQWLCEGAVQAGSLDDISVIVMQRTGGVR